jgi:hypothetical protein
MNVRSHSSQRLARCFIGTVVLCVVTLVATCGSDRGPNPVTEPNDTTSTPPPPPPPPRAIEQKPNRLYGEQALLGAGRIQTWIELGERSGSPVAVGTTFTEEMLSGLPGQSVMLSLGLPQPVRDETLFDHVLFDWMPGGHGPPGVYNVPHFDFHFYMIPRPEREAIRSSDPMTEVQGAWVPSDYVMDPAVIDQMGLHWYDATAPEWTGDRFTRTFIWVSHAGEWIALEPMVTLQYFLTSRQSVTAPIKQPERYQRSGAWPTEYVVEFDSATNQYDVYMTGLVLRTAD